MLLSYLQTSRLIRLVYLVAFIFLSFSCIEKLGINIDDYVFSSVNRPNLLDLPDSSASIYADATRAILVMLGLGLISDGLFRLIRSNIWFVRTLIALLTAFDHHFATIFVGGMACVTLFMMWVETYPPFEIEASLAKIRDSTPISFDPDLFRVNPTTGLPMLDDVFDVGGNIYLSAPTWTD